MSDLKIENLELKEGSESGHCCFESSITDENGDVVCEFFDKEEAKLVFDALVSQSKLASDLAESQAEVERLREMLGIAYLDMTGKRKMEGDEFAVMQKLTSKDGE